MYVAATFRQECIPRFKNFSKIIFGKLYDIFKFLFHYQSIIYIFFWKTFLKYDCF